MSGQSAPPVPRLRNSEDKLYQACLDACIQGIENIPVNRRCSATPAPNNNTTAELNPTNGLTVERASTETILIEPSSSLLSPPPSPERRKVNTKPSSPTSPLPSSATMDRSRLHGAPPTGPRGHGAPPMTRPLASQGPIRRPLDYGTPSLRPLGVVPQHPNLASSGWASGDARSNLAIQPAANAGNIKLKKNAVKIVGAAGPAPATPSRPAAPTPSVASSPAPGSVKAQPKAAEGPATPSPATKAVSSQKENVKSNDASSSYLEVLATRLISEISAVPSRASEGSPLAGPDRSMFSFDDGPGTTDTKDEPADLKKTSDGGSRLAKEAEKAEHNAKNDAAATKVELAKANKAKADKAADIRHAAMASVFKEAAEHIGMSELELQSERAAMASIFKEAAERIGISELELKNEYMRRAGEYVATLPGNKGNMALLIKIVLKKLRNTYVPDTKTDHENNEIIKARFALAIANYIRSLSKKGLEPRTTESVKQTLKDVDGDFLELCAKLVEDKYISLETLEEVTGLVNKMLDSLPKAEPAVAAIAKETKPVVRETKPASQDPVDNMTAWPTQAKRENPAAHRTCILKGVSKVTSIHQLQALVWGGKLESISMPEPGSSNALVKFFTPAACEKYHKDTANGIEVTGDISNAVVFVEKGAGPNSINDVIQNCIDGDASRCVRAIGAEEKDDMVLMKLARGRSQTKREVDTIKQGKTAHGHPYIEFRFANVYNALNFKKELMANDDWEHCTIQYAPDPCEMARGVHYKDGEEEDKKPGFFG